ncbi:MAG: peptidase M23 [Chitinophagaceae bacterium]|nr:MAG: peptidase M23 [Chitinophagaceae bacterium]
MSTNLNDILKKHQAEFHAVVPFNPIIDELLPLDFTENNKELTTEILNDTNKYSDYIFNKLKQANAKYGIGGYAEHRTVYSRSKLFGPSKVSPPTGGGDLEGAEPRRLHLGTDIWGPANTPVMAPLNGIIHSFAFNDNFGDYGTTIILTHQLEGVSFHTLHGHLSLNSIKNLQEGNLVRKGDVFAEFGMQFENGHWPPHLHFQVIIDLEGWNGDYPGVCKFSEKEEWLQNCPDPDLILRMKPPSPKGE